MTSRHLPNEPERQPSFSRFGFRSRLQTIVEVDTSCSSAAKNSGGERRKRDAQQIAIRGVKRPLTEVTARNKNEGVIPFQGRRCCVEGSPCQRAAKRAALPPTRATTTTPPPQAHRENLTRTELPTACPAELQKRNMKSAQVSPSGGGVPKLASIRTKTNLDEKRTSHARLQTEHLQLQKSFALWRQLVAEAQSHKDDEELATWAEERQGILKSTKKLQDKVEELQEKLTEYREQNELLEFRILEVDHCQTKQCPPCVGATMTSQETSFCSTGCSQPEDPCLKLFYEQVAVYQDLDFKAEELLEELRQLSGTPGLNCVQRSVLARSAACVRRCKEDLRCSLTPQQAAGPSMHAQEPVATQLEWLDKLLLGGGRAERPSDEAEFSDQSLQQETSLTESEIGQALMTAEWSSSLTESQQKTVEHQHSEDEGLGEDSSRRSTEPNSLISEDPDSRTLQGALDDLKRKNEGLRLELRQAEVLVRTLKVQADKVQDLECQLTRTEQERSECQEQILELEEAENDARLESQTLRALVENLRRREDDLEKSLCATRDRLEECEQRASEAGSTSEELRGQIGYLEELVYKYEEHISGLERTEREIHRKLAETAARPKADAEVQVGEGPKDYNDASVQVEVEDPLCRCPVKKDLLARLQSLEEKDGVLREQLHQVDGINLKLWQKLHCLETDIGECKRQEGSWGPEQHHREAAARLEGLLGGQDGESSDAKREKSEDEIGERVLILECNERKLREQLMQLERINQDFERELEIRERLNRDKEHEQTRWSEREEQLKGAISELEEERLSLRMQTTQLETERASLREALEQLQEEYGRLKLAHCQETEDLHARHRETTQVLQDTTRQDVEVLRLSQQALLLKNEQEELRSQVNEMSLAFETELRALRACHELEEKRLHDEMLTLRCRDDQCCTRVQELATQRERLESDLMERERQLETLDADFRARAVAMEEERGLLEDELQRKMREMEESTGCAVRELEEKRKQLEKSLRVDMEDLRSKESSYKVRIGELERHVESLRREVTNIVADSGEMEYTEEADDDYRRRIEDLEKKEAAYVETLENADQIISQMEVRYRDNIQRLENSERGLQERVSQLEITETELRSTIQSERRTSDGWRAADLVRELVEAESRESALKEHTDELEASQRAMHQKIRELERSNQHLREEMKDYEDASRAAEDLKRDQVKLKEEVTQLKRSEAALKETLAQADIILAQREQVLMTRVSELEAEGQESQEMVRQLREQVRLLQGQLDQVQLQQASNTAMGSEETTEEEISDLKLECLSASRAHLSDLDSVRRNQEKVIEHLEDGKTEAETKLRQLQRNVLLRGGGTAVHVAIDAGDSGARRLQQRVSDLEQLVMGRPPLKDCKQTQTAPYCNSRSVTAPVSPALSLENLCSERVLLFASPELSEVGPREGEEGEGMSGVREEEVACLGMEERIHLETCMKRAMAAMERDLKRKSDQQQHQQQHHFNTVFVCHNQDEDEEEDVNCRMPPSPACSSTSGCESDCSSSGGSCRWPTRTPGQNCEDPYASDPEDRTLPSSLPKKHTVTARELPTLMKTRIIYPSITKTEVKEMPTLVSRHSEFSVNENSTEINTCLPDAPRDFCVLRRVGRDSLLVGWTPPTRLGLDSYQIFVDGQLHQRVRSPDRTKALLHKLDLSRALTIAICSVMAPPSQKPHTQGEATAISQPALLTYQPVP